MSVEGPFGVADFSQPVPEQPVVDVRRARSSYRDALHFAIGWLDSSNEIGSLSRPNAIYRDVG